MPQNARRRFPGDTGGPWGTGLLGTGLAIATIGVGYILTEPERLPPPLAWINQFIPIAGWGLLFVGAGLFSVIRAFSPPQRPVDVAPAVTVVSLWSAFFIVFWLYEGLWLGHWTRDWLGGMVYGAFASLLVCFSRTVNPPTGRR
jgi:hypothetical protein